MGNRQDKGQIEALWPLSLMVVDGLFQSVTLVVDLHWTAAVCHKGMMRIKHGLRQEIGHKGTMTFT